MRLLTVLLLMASSRRATCAALMGGTARGDRLWDGKPVLSPVQLLHPHTDMAHRYWSDLLVERSSPAQQLVVDATAGNG